MSDLIIDAISDTHNKHKFLKLPGGDVLIHSGDATMGGTVKEVIAFLDWFADQDYTNLIFVPGNHDWLFEDNASLCKSECANRGIILLNDSGVEIQCTKIWGSPVQPKFGNWAFNRNTTNIADHWSLIPKDTEILITHGPASELLDFIPYQNKSVGCPQLRHTIDNSEIKLHICGHIHEGRGYKYLNGKTFVNASCLDGRYSLINENPIRIIKDIAGEYFIKELVLGETSQSS